jgi:hypothetical protein
LEPQVNPVALQGALLLPEMVPIAIMEAVLIL